MTTLAEQIEIMRLKMVSEAAAAQGDVAHLAGAMFQADAELMRMIEDMERGQARRAADIRAALHRIAGRIGQLPPPDLAPVLALADPRSGAARESLLAPCDTPAGRRPQGALPPRAGDAATAVGRRTA